MGFVIFAAIFILASLIAVGVGVFGPKTYERVDGYGGRNKVESPTHIGFYGGIAASVFLVLAALIFVPAGINDVPSRTIGVPITFGKAGAPLSPGFHWEMPWTSVASISEKVQTDNYNLDPNTPSRTGTCITIRLGGAQEGCADVSITYQVEASAGPTLYLDYGSSGDVTQQIQDNLVYRDLRSDMNQTLGDYNPITDALQTGTSGTSQFSRFNPAITSLLTAHIGKDVKIISFDLQYVHYSTAVQNQLDGIQQKQGQLQQEKEQLLINSATASANKALVSQTGNLSPAQLEQECFTIVQDAEKNGYALPETWGNCLSGSSTSGVIVSK